MVMVLQLPASIHEEMIAHARRELPNECVGMLIGSREGVVMEYLPLVNEQPTPTTFFTEPLSMLYAERRCRALGLHVLGIFHSHPTGGNTPSQRDLANHYSPDVLCLIVTMAKEPPELAAWYIEAEGARRAEVRS
jgi:proteasome lid subunit RPN8/RPN11